MNLDSLPLALSHIGYLVANLTKKNINTSVQEIKELLQTFGLEAEQHLYKIVVQQLHWPSIIKTKSTSAFTGTGSSSNSVANLCIITAETEEESTGQLPLSFSGSNGSLIVLLLQQLALSTPLQKFATSLSSEISSPENSQKIVRGNWVNSVCKILKLSTVQEVVVCLQLLDSFDTHIATQASVVLSTKLPELVQIFIAAEGTGPDLSDLSTETLHRILTGCNKKRTWGLPLTDAQISLLVVTIQKDFQQQQSPLVVLPIAYPNSDIIKESLQLPLVDNMGSKTMGDDSIADWLSETGYIFCDSVDACKKHFVRNGTSNITPEAVAKAVGFMMKTQAGLQVDYIHVKSFSEAAVSWTDSNEKSRSVRSNFADINAQSPAGTSSSSSSPDCWNVEIFMQSLFELVPNFDGLDAIWKLDHQGFFVKDRAFLNFVLTAIKYLLPGTMTDSFPIDFLLRPWKNTEEQLVLVSILLENPNLFCFTDYPCLLIQTEGLKSAPEMETKELHNWKCLSLIEVLLSLADVGHYGPVKEIFKYPIQHCPDVFVLGLLQVTSPRTVLWQDLLKLAVPTFMCTHPNASTVLHYLWNATKDTTTVQQISIHAMAEWYMMVENDQTRLSRILDVAQDLKALSMLLNAKPFAFVIDLACLAYRREYLKLDKWMPDKISEHGEPFVTSCLKFLQVRCPILMGGKEDLMPKSTQLPHETISTMVTALQNCTIGLPQEHLDTIMTMVQNLTAWTRTRPMSSLLGGFPNQSDNIGNLASSLGNLSIGSSTVAPASMLTSTMNIAAMGAIGSNIPASSPARPTVSVAQGQSSQASLTSILPQLSYSVTPTTLPHLTANSSAALSDTLRPQPAPTQSAFNPQRPMQLTEILDIPAMISKEVDDEANSYFQRIYNHPPHPTLTIEEVLDMLKEFHNSTTEREKEVYSCMLKNLFEEYKFFPTYPYRELILTAKLFGGLIEQGFVEFMALGVALRFVMEALQKPHGSKMYYFGVVALDRFRSRMKDYPRYCKHLLSIKHFNDFPPHLISYIKHGSESREPPNRPTGEVLPHSLLVQINATGGASWNGGSMASQSGLSLVKSITSTTTTTSNVVTKSQSMVSPATKPSMSSANIETLLDATEEERKYSPPPENLQEKIAFIFNNLSQINLSQKCKELKEELLEDYWEWLAQYMVMKRASIENNFHNLYSSFLDSLAMPHFTKLVMQETLRNVRVLLLTDKASVNSSDKSLLKNLGHWFGLLTLGKNKPILHIEIDLKSLLVEAYRNGLQELQYVVPFVVKVIESCSKSAVFKPPNPWTMAIMSLLAELHAEPDMKLHLKFEIEVLCNKLELNLKEHVKPSNILRNPEKLARIQPQLTFPSRRAESTPLFSGYQGSNVPYSDWHGPQERRSSVAPGKPAPKDLYQTPKPESGLSTQSSSAGATPTPPSLSSAQASVTPTPLQVLPQQPLEAKFAYKDVTINAQRFFENNIVLSHQLYNLENSAHLKQIIKHSFEIAVQEISSIVAERSIKVAIQTGEHLIKKDFALESDAVKLRLATHHLVRNLTAAQAMMPCKDHLATTMAKGLKQNLMASFSRTSPQQLEHVDHFVNSVAQDNVPMACAFIQKSAAEKALQEIDKRLGPDYEARKLARAEGKHYYDSQVLSFQNDRIPEKIRMKVGGPSQAEMVVYHEFGRSIPGFIPRSDSEAQDQVPEGFFLPKPVPVSSTYNTEQSSAFTMLSDRLITEVEHLIQTYSTISPPSLLALLHSILDCLMICRTNPDTSAHQVLIKKSVENLLEGAREFPTDPELNQLVIRFRDVHIILIKTLCETPRLYGNPHISKLVARAWTEAREEVRYNIDVMDWLLRSNVIHIPAVDEHLSRVIEELHPLLPLTTHLLFIIKFIQAYLVDDSSIITEGDIPLTLEKLIRLCQSRQVPDMLLNVVDSIRIRHEVLVGMERGGQNHVADSTGVSLTGSVSRNLGFSSPTSQHFYSGVNQAKDLNDPPGLKDKTEMLLRHWIKMYHTGNGDHTSSQAFQVIVKEMDVHGILKTDEVITRFFRLAISICRDLCMRYILDSNSSNSATFVRNKCFPQLDAFVRLIALLVKQSGEPSNPTAKINLLNKVLGLISGIMLNDIETMSNEFQQLAYHRMLIMLFLELNAPETVLESINLPVLVAFTQTLHVLRPSKCPGFAYAWLEIVSHRVFIGRMLAITPQQKGWTMYSMLFTDLFKFLAPYLRNVELSKPFTMLYKGTLRVLLVLLHDFPEFLCEFHYTFCDVIPPNCIQMRNLILSAYPPKMRLPDPFMPNLKVDRLSEISVSPKIHANIPQLIQPAELKDNLDSYLKNRSPVTFLSELRSYLQVSNEPGVRYNMQVMNALVLYVGMQAISHIQSKGLTPSMSTISHSAHMDIFENLAVDLDTEGRYLFLVAIANQLRYPNSHTHYFSCTLLYLFTEANNETIQEQITRVLLERLIGNRPQPWGLLITFIELLKNPGLKFWNHDFVKCAPEIEKIFDSVARSCMVSKNAQTE